MSLEDALKANTAALERHTATIEKMLAGAGAAAKPAAAKAAEKPADKPAEKPAAKAAAKPAAKTEKAKGQMTSDDVATIVTKFLKTGSAEEREERKTQVKTIIDHYGADRFTNIDPAHFEEAIGFLRVYEEGGVPDFGDESGAADEDETMV